MDTRSVNELYHYGVKGMKWGVRRAEKRAARATRKVEKKLTRAGQLEGAARYVTNSAEKKARVEIRNAKNNEKVANQYASEGKRIRAGIARWAANESRKSAKEIRSQAREDAKVYLEKSKHYRQKASKIATKKNVSLGQDRVNDILKRSSREGYQNEKMFDQGMTTLYGEDWRHSN